MSELSVCARRDVTGMGVTGMGVFCRTVVLGQVAVRYYGGLSQLIGTKHSYWSRVTFREKALLTFGVHSSPMSLGLVERD